MQATINKKNALNSNSGVFFTLLYFSLLLAFLYNSLLFSSGVFSYLVNIGKSIIALDSGSLIKFLDNVVLATWPNLLTSLFSMFFLWNFSAFIKNFKENFENIFSSKTIKNLEAASLAIFFLIIIGLFSNLINWVWMSKNLAYLNNDDVRNYTKNLSIVKTNECYPECKLNPDQSFSFSDNTTTEEIHDFFNYENITMPYDIEDTELVKGIVFDQNLIVFFLFLESIILIFKKGKQLQEEKDLTI